MPRTVAPCHYTHPDGRPCGSPAVRGEQFCYYHNPVRRPAARTKAAAIEFFIPGLWDPGAIQAALSEVVCRLADNSVDTRRAGLLLTGIQMAHANLAASTSHARQVRTFETSADFAPDPDQP